jgi:hypothetical protein
MQIHVDADPKHCWKDCLNRLDLPRACKGGLLDLDKIVPQFWRSFEIYKQHMLTSSPWHLKATSTDTGRSAIFFLSLQLFFFLAGD